MFPGLPIAIESIPILQSPKPDIQILLSFAFLEQILLILQDLVLIDVDHLYLRLQLLDEIWVMDDHLLELLILFVFFFLAQHECAEFLKLRLEVGCVLLFLELA